MAAMLEMRGITKRYGDVRANHLIDLTVQAGSIVGLLGENGSGKSTLMKVLYGMVAPDAGTITFRGRELRVASPHDAIAAGIGMIHQHFTLVDAMTVTENVMLGWSEAGRWLRTRSIAAMVRTASKSYRLDVDPDAVVGSLALGVRQRVEIVKAILRGAKLLILDEPTSILSPPEVAGLMDVLRRLRDEGHAVIFISHKLGEVLDLCDQVVVLRDGEVSGRTVVAGATREQLARMMVDRDLAEPTHRSDRAPGAARLVVTQLAANDAAGVQRLKDATFTLHAGEIVALAGVDGNGQAELANALAGLALPAAGRLTVDGRDLTRESAGARLAAGLAYIPADRAATSLVRDMSVADNLALRDFDRAPLALGWRLDRTAMREHAAARVKAFDVRCANTQVAVRTLSGGNQQKVVLAREIGRNPAVLIAFQPTWGLDPGATRFVIDQILALRSRGGAILYISSELEEVLALGDRIGVIANGRIVEIVPRADADVGRIGMLMAGTGGDR